MRPTSDSRTSGAPGGAGSAVALGVGATTSFVERLRGALTDARPARLVRLAAPDRPAAARELRDLARNVTALRVRDLRLGVESGVASTGTRPSGRGEHVVPVELSWRTPDAGRSRVVLPLTVLESAGSIHFVTLRGPGSPGARPPGPVPLWVLHRVWVRNTARATVVVSSPTQTARFSRLAEHAVSVVRRAVRRWDGPLVVEVPADQRELTRALGSQPGTWSGTAAVTSVVGDPSVTSAPAHVFVNPRVLGRLGRRGAQIVLSHETAHVAVAAARSTMPLWLAEGFADQVALAQVDLPVTTLAAQVLARVRRDGAPTRLPRDRDFGPGRPQAGAAYEAAWLACRMIADRYGEQRLLAFYRAADLGSSTQGLFGDVLGTDRSGFTRAWTAQLRRLASR